MPGVVCGGCGQGETVSFTRGTRLADVGCPGCGKKELRVPRRPAAKTTKGRTYESCVMCGRRGLSHLHRPYEWEPKSATVNAGPYPPGTPCCWTHEPVPSARTPHWLVLDDLKDRLGPSKLWEWPDDAQRAGLAAVARIPPVSCPVCVAAGHNADWVPGPGGSDFESQQAYAFERGSALLAHCWDCGHTLELAAVIEGGPYVSTVVMPSQARLWGGPEGVVAVRRLSPMRRVGEVDAWWGGPVHGRGQVIPSTWHGGALGEEAMRFPSAEAAQAGLDSVFGPGSKWQLPIGEPVRIVPVPLGGGLR